MNSSASGQPLVSIVLPTYKRAHVLPHAIRSVLNQSYANLELIIVDDNSPDDTPAVVQAFSDPRIRYVRNDPNLKLPRALNKGFSLARGHYLTWTSDDNLLGETAIERMVQRLQQGDSDFVYADYFLFSEADTEGRPLEPRHDRLPDRLQLDKGNHIGACFLYTRRLYETVGDYDPELFLVEDYDYFMRAAQHFRFCHLAEPLYYFRRDDATLYYSRFLEVKASDVLARFKNGLLDERQAVEVMVSLLMRDLGGLKNPLLRQSHELTSRLSYRLNALNRRFVARYLHRLLGSSVGPILRQYRSGERGFGASRDELKKLMANLADVRHD